MPSSVEPAQTPDPHSLKYNVCFTVPTCRVEHASGPEIMQGIVGGAGIIESDSPGIVIMLVTQLKTCVTPGNLLMLSEDQISERNVYLRLW